eukprot:SAG22_NODE_877_length_6715_cov_28.285369_8_plen_346_part_00
MAAASLFPVPDTLLQSGLTLRGAELAYWTSGALNADKSNVILHPTSFDATHVDLVYNVGSGKLLDTDTHFVVVCNLFGNGTGTSPSNIKPPHDRDRYPLITVHDNVRMQALLLDSLGIEQIALIYGYSLGAKQAFQWAATYPSRVHRVAAVCGLAKTTDYNKVFLDSLVACLTADPAYQRDGHFTEQPWAGLRAFARIYAGWGVSPAFYAQEVWRQQGFSSLEDFVVGSYEKGFCNGNAGNLLAQLATWRASDISNNPVFGADIRKALGAITAKVMYMPCRTDSYFRPENAEEEAAHIADCEYVVLESVWGHRAGDPSRPGQEADAAFIREHVHRLLAASPKSSL